MELQKLPQNFTVCKVSCINEIDFKQDYVFLSKTPDEISLVCETASTPANTTACEAGWKAFKVSGVLDFGMVGVIAKISNMLADAGISIFVVSTYNTDYILVKSNNFEVAAHVLEHSGYTVI